MTEAAAALDGAPRRVQLELHEELHARPAMRVTDACVVSYWVQRGLVAEEAEAAVRAACAAFGKPGPEPGTRHHVLEADSWALKYERHGEFVSWQVRMEIDPALPLAHWLVHADARLALPPGFLARIGATPMLAATHVVVWPAAEDAVLPHARRTMGQLVNKTADEAASAFPDLLGAWIADRKAVVLTHLTLDDAGFTRYLLLDMQLLPQQRRREVQRLVELEGYRTLAMLGFPQAQQEAQALGELEQRLLQAVNQMRMAAAPPGEAAVQDPQQIFAELVELASQVEHVAARSRYRFSATRAYHHIVQRRLEDLNEDRITGVQTLGSFLRRRFVPAMEFCETTDARLNDVASRVQRAVAVMQVRIETQRETDNQQLLQALAHRQHLQLRLQQTVEGLSVVAISYYAVSLLGYVFKLLKSIPALEALHVPVEAATGLSVIPVVLVVAWFVRRIRQHHAAD